MILWFEMPDDQDWDEEFWEHLGEGPEWTRIDQDFARANARVEDHESISIEMPASALPAVQAIIAAARAGEYGPDVQKYWLAARESP